MERGLQIRYGHAADSMHRSRSAQTLDTTIRLTDIYRLLLKSSTLTILTPYERDWIMRHPQLEPANFHKSP